MSWTKVEAAKPQRYLIVRGAIFEGDDRRAVRMVTWDGLAWTHEPNDTPVQRFGHQVTHWMPLPGHRRMMSSPGNDKSPSIKGLRYFYSDS